MAATVHEDGSQADQLFLAQGFVVNKHYMSRHERAPFIRLVRARDETEAVEKVEKYYCRPDPYGVDVYADVREVTAVID